MTAAPSSSMAKSFSKPFDGESVSYVSPRMSDKEFNQLRERIFSAIGIEIRDHKKPLLVNRLSKRLRHLGLPSFSAYIQFIDQSPDRMKEMIELVDAVTTNKTDFFREPKHFDFLTEKALPQLMAMPGRGNRTIRVWSAASSSGEEPYTLAICLSEFFAHHPGWSFEILASDVSETMLRAAAAGIYKEDRVRPIPMNLMRKYFLKGHGRYKVKPELARTVTYKKINLKHDFYNTVNGFDVIFCRNVLIYFNQESQQQITQKHWRALRPGGFLFLGHSETLHGGDGYYSYAAPSVYQKMAPAP